MSAGLIATLLIAAIVNLALLFFLWRRAKPTPDQTSGLSILAETFDRQMIDLTKRMTDLHATVDTKISAGSREMARAVENQFRESAKLIKDVTEGLTKLDETNRQVVSFADQLQSLQDILKNPKQRGVLGEYYLETLLKNVLPPGSFAMQYAFKDGTIVDAAVFVKEKIIPVDSKFSLENYNRLVNERDPLERERLEKTFKAR